MSDDTAIDLAFLARELRQVALNLGSLRHEVNVLTEIAMRQHGTLSALLTEIRAKQFPA